MSMTDHHLSASQQQIGTSVQAVVNVSSASVQTVSQQDSGKKARKRRFPASQLPERLKQESSKYINLITVMP